MMETHNTREVEEIDVLNKLRDLFGSLWQENKNGDPIWEVTVEVASAMHSLLHHQLQKAHQAGIDEAVEVVKGKKRLQEYQHFDEETPLKDELYNQALDDTIKALQDKK